MKKEARKEKSRTQSYSAIVSGSFKSQNPLRLLLFSISGILAAEILEAVILYLYQPLTAVEAVLYSMFIPSLLIFPIFYFFAFRPLRMHIAEHKQIEKELLQKEELEERFFNSSGSLLIAHMDRDFNFIKVNETYARAGGQKPEYFTGKNHFELYPHVENEQIFRHVVETGEPFTVYDKPFEFPDQPELGVTYWNWDLQPVKDPDGSIVGLVLSLVDVSQRKRAQQEVEYERARLKSILDATPDGVYIINIDYDIEYVNPVIEKEFGPINGQKCYTYFRGEDEICEECAYSDDFSEKGSRQEWDSTKTGKIYEIYDTPLRNVDGSYPKLNILHDITERKQVEVELEKRNQALEAFSELEHRQHEVSETLRVAANELAQSLDMNNVLQVLLKHTRMLLKADAAGVLFLEGETQMKTQAVKTFEDEADTNIQLPEVLNYADNPFFHQLLQTRKSILIEDTEKAPGWVIYPGTERLRNMMVVPVIIEDNLIGVVALGKIQPGFFTEEYVHWAEVLVGQAAVAIQNAWLFDQVQTGSERLQQLSRRLVEFQESERRYIAFELHDQASQVLSSLLLGLGALDKLSENPQAVRTQAAELKKMTNEVLKDLHSLAVNLRPAGLDHLGLTSAIEQLVKTFTQNSSLSIKLKSIGMRNDERLAQNIETNLYRIVQEAITNVIRHANANQVDIILEKRNGSVLMVIEDDGDGFNPKFSDDGQHLGLFSMQERAEMLNGKLNLESVPGRGTTLVVEVPDDTHIAG